MALQACVEKLEKANLHKFVQESFAYYHAMITKGETGLIPESTLLPVENLKKLEDFPKRSTDTFPQDLLDRTVMMKLNGGLGTSMGLSKAKSLLVVKEGLSFLDIFANQIIFFREQRINTPVSKNRPRDENKLRGLRFMLMNSFSTTEDTKELLEKYPDLLEGTDFSEFELLQNKIPKIRQKDFYPVEYPSDRDCEWCPPGHGDLYTALNASGKLDYFLEHNVEFLFVSNSDNLGATMDLDILRYMDEEGLDFIMEVCQRSEADKKGGHLAKDAKTGNLLLRESAQCPPEDADAFQDIKKHQYFNTNNCWIRLSSLKKALTKSNGFLPLPLIRNGKNVNPVDPQSEKVYQMETAMGTAICLFEKSSAVVVSRTRFSPVKTCTDLLALRSDCYVLRPSFITSLEPERKGVPPKISLDEKYYKFVDDFEKHFKNALPSLIHCESLSIKGPVEFETGVSLEGNIVIVNEGSEVKCVKQGKYKDTTITL